MSLQHQVVATMMYGVEIAQQVMHDMEITEEDLRWFALVSAAMQIGPHDELKSRRYTRINAFLSMRVFLAHPMTIRELVFSKCHCGEEIVGFEAVKKYAAREKPLCGHIDRLVEILRIVQESRAEFISPPWGLDRDSMVRLLDQLFESGRIASFSVDYKGDSNTFQALLSTEGIRFLREVDDMLESKMTVF